MAAASAPPLAVVGSQFCAPQVLPLTLKTKLNGAAPSPIPPAPSCCGSASPSSAPAPAASSSTPPAGPSSPCKERGDSGNGGDLLFTALPMATPMTGLDVFLARTTPQNVADFKDQG
ncbi:hypothetical protein BAE44_0018835 [Dichanthelium oligosanthes]|uniref:Uncharacterized protein n=1 Tax=Dichanthelium oligosanthes TaxID=888268 RepID=A0A1E5V4Q3_9POAL|nr:hypothetical protein BAE44_0018835 [Dichanthelium oligosanthes]